MRVLKSIFETVPAWLLIGIAIVTVSTSVTKASPTRGGSNTFTHRSNQDTEKEQCRTKCSQQALQPLFISGKCICDTIGDGDCAADKNHGCKTFCKEIKNQEFVGCYKDECICDQNKL
ncbi:hypothetical protein BDA99DRAFT_562684 [Phascolomyces articulosus]|uniref:Uncharacterized protein n=1 Tax=Phascolomyces articulosus TaxID=60185 RepID=A0AAD5PAU7_9FUNG|nr:hypothetical protein BDA99DRAFT_562684 [Phascolomyces articulosus]